MESDEQQNTAAFPPVDSAPSAEQGMEATALSIGEQRYQALRTVTAHLVWRANSDGAIDTPMEQWAYFTGQSWNEYCGWGWLDAVHPEDQGRVRALWRRVVVSQSAYRVEYRLRHRSGDYRYMISRGLPIEDEKGAVREWIGANIDITERRRTEQILATAYQRERLLNEIGQAVRHTANINALQHDVVRKLGEAMKVDRCYLVLIEKSSDHVRCVAEWRRDGFPALASEEQLSQFTEKLCRIFQTQQSYVLNDAWQLSLSLEGETFFRDMQIQSLINVPIFADTELEAILGVAKSTSHIWSLEEIGQVEQVAAVTRTAMEAARIRLREQTIAAQLQAALQPAVPSELPGLAVAHHYRAALGESEIGGDFYDVFSTSEECAYLIIGDLSGKGLAAASQVATVRNMLRFALYNDSRLQNAITRLNDTIVENALLAGFATLFVGRYDRHAQTLTYVNCGQESGLLRRAETGMVEELAATAPILGAFQGWTAEERTVTLAAGDTLAIFTDGLTEIGPNRADLLGIEGVADRLRRQEPQRDPHAIAARLVADAESYNQGGVRDDQCLLICVAAEPQH